MPDETPAVREQAKLFKRYYDKMGSPQPGTGITRVMASSGPASGWRTKPAWATWSRATLSNAGIGLPGVPPVIFPHEEEEGVNAEER